MDRYPTHQAYALQQPSQSSSLPLPDWARAFRIILIILGGVFALLLLMFLLVNEATESSFYTESGRAAINILLGLGVVILLLAVPYLLASLIYAFLWSTSLRGKGYRSYAGTTWFLIAAPLATCVPLGVLVSLWF